MDRPGKPSDADIVAKYGLAAIFHPCDLRCQTVAGLWPSSELTTCLKKSQGILVADTYGGVEAIRWARDAYNERPGFFMLKTNG